ncbi:MAG TPA: DNA primase [Methylomirabilota bacterium]|nr:DNA primase [Methylomirabilota bacterium]
MLDSPIEEIKARVPVLDLVQDFVQLKKAGTNYKGICPFHAEKSPSFMVSPSKQIWHCFGCGLGGDIFEFIKQIENVEFGDALKILADRAGVELKKPTQEQIQGDRKKDVLYEINQKAAEYFARVLWESNAGSEALGYLRKRGLTDPTIKNWQLGFAPNDYHYLENYLAKSFDKKDIELAGMIIKSDKDSSYFDRFHDRIMFPILNLHGQVVGFTGRLLHDKPNTGKYVNSPETPIYNKSREIYGLYQAKQAIKKLDRAILVEGNMDVIACHQVGSNTAVATSGTALTEQQLFVLKRFTENLVFAFDSDAAGSTATKRALELALNNSFNVKIASLGGAKDPDELIKRGIGLWEKVIESAGNFLDYFFDQIFTQNKPETVEGKREITKELAPLIYRISDPITKAHYVRKLAQGINVAETAVWDIINKLNIPQAVRRASLERRKSRREILEDRLLGLSLLLKDNQFLSQFTPDNFRSDNQEIFNALKEGRKNIDPFKAELLSFGADMDVKEQNLDAGSELVKTAKDLHKIILHDSMMELTSQISTAELNKNKEMIEQLSKKYLALSKEMGNYK